jgi:hypothetical protein
MAFDEQLANSVRKQLGRKAGLVEKKMFGGLAFLINGNMRSAFTATTSSFVLHQSPPMPRSKNPARASLISLVGQ